MQRETIALGDWAPDLEHKPHGGLFTAENVYPVQGGYDPFPQVRPLTTNDLPTGILGAFATIASDNTSIFFMGNAASLRKQTSTAVTDVSKAGGYTTSGNIWDFAEYEGTIVATNFNDPPQKYVVGTSTLFEDLKSTSPAAPKAKYVARIGQFIFLGYLDDGTNVEPNRLQWSAIGDPDDWPTPGTTDAQNKQADQEYLNPEYGPIVGIVGGDEFGLVFQRSAITRITYTGDVSIFDINTFEEKIGLLTPRAHATVGGFTYFISESGFYRTDGNSVQPIGQEKTDRTFRRHYVTLATTNVSTAVDYERDLIIFMVATDPYPMYCYNFSLGRWSRARWKYFVQDLEQASPATPELDLIFSGFTLGSSPSPLPVLVGDYDRTGASVPSGQRRSYRIGVETSVSPSYHILKTARRYLANGDVATVNGLRFLMGGADSSGSSVYNLYANGGSSEIISQSAFSPSTEGTLATLNTSVPGFCTHNLRVSGQYHIFTIERANDDSNGARNLSALAIEFTRDGSR